MFSIHSVNSDRELRFQYLKDEYLEVELKGNGLSAVTGVWIYTDANGLSTFFQKLANFREPWQGAQTWESLEEDFSISATCSNLGQVTFTIKLRHFLVGQEDWHLEAGLATELGQLEQFAKDAKAFFQGNGG